MPAVDTIVFDVGRVLYDFDHEISFEFLKANGAQFNRDTFYRDVLLDEYERGDISTERFVEILEKLFPAPVSRELLLKHWREIFQPIPEMLELLASLKARYRVYLLSNTCDLHWSFLDRQFGIEEIAHGSVTSFGARARKPNPAIFEEAERRFQLIPDRSLFIDDLLPNVEAARKRGWHAIHHVDPQTTLSELVRHGVQV